ncbi:MAG: alkaline phosphatase family protein [Planctomycetota bacterium]|jgi:predicted AlkP superfamily phosphohydrolase/phosphomutase
MKSGRLIIIGLDGVPFSLLKDLAESGIMVNTAQIIKDGFFTRMRSSVPEVSSVAWSSIITGANPGSHGIFGFTDLFPHSYELRFPNFGDLKSPPFWEISEGKSIIMNVPSTYPVRDMNGAHISGFVSIHFDRSVYPQSLIPALKSVDYRLDVDSQKAHEDLSLFLEDLDQTLSGRIKASEHLWEYTDWRTFMLAFTGTDRLMHFLFPAYEDENHKYHKDFLNHFQRIDQAIGTIYRRLKENDILIMLSDHGFEELESDVYVNCLLIQEGFLKFKSGTEPKLMNIDSGTKAFALDPARIYINQKGKYPAGGVDGSDKDARIRELADLFTSLEIDGKKVIQQVCLAPDAYSGPYIEQAPDMVLIANKGFNLKGAVAAQKLVDKGPFAGKHTYHDAFLLLNNRSIAPNFEREPSVIDAGKLIQSITTSS